VAYHELKGDLFNSNAHTIVNTVNCVGVMGKGIALEFKRRFPQMFQEYKRVCATGELRPGMILPYWSSTPQILNFAVKDHWRQPSRLVWIEECLARFVHNYARLGVTSIALPHLGAMNGWIPWPATHAMIRKYLGPLQDIDVFLYEYCPNVRNPEFERSLEETS